MSSARMATTTSNSINVTARRRGDFRSAIGVPTNAWVPGLFGLIEKTARSYYRQSNQGRHVDARRVGRAFEPPLYQDARRQLVRPKAPGGPESALRRRYDVRGGGGNYDPSPP